MHFRWISKALHKFFFAQSSACLFHQLDFFRCKIHTHALDGISRHWNVFGSLDLFQKVLLTQSSRLRWEWLLRLFNQILLALRILRMLDRWDIVVKHLMFLVLIVRRAWTEVWLDFWRWRFRSMQVSAAQESFNASHTWQVRRIGSRRCQDLSLISSSRSKISTESSPSASAFRCWRPLFLLNCPLKV